MMIVAQCSITGQKVRARNEAQALTGGRLFICGNNWQPLLQASACCPLRTQRYASVKETQTCSRWTRNIICKSVTTIPDPPPLVIPCPRETVGSGRDSRQNRQSIHPSAWLEWSITEFLGPACCYHRNRRDGTRGELLSPDRSFLKCVFVCVCVCAHIRVSVFAWARETPRACELACVNVQQMLTKVTYSVWH